VSAALRTLADVEAAGAALWREQRAAGAPPLSQAQADAAAAILAPYLHLLAPHGAQAA
jgi:hypothetical protein